MKFLRDEKGQMLLLTLLSTTVLFGFLAFAIDAGVMFRAKRNLQIAADAAATAGALSLTYNGTGTTGVAAAKKDAYCAAYANGYEGSNVSYTCVNTVAANPTSATIYLNAPPTNGYHQSTGYFEAILTESNPTIFGNMLGIHSLNISARAVGGSPNAGAPCTWLMDPTGYDLQLQGSVDIESQGCGIYINSNNACSICANGNKTFDVNAAYLNTVGGQGANIVGSTPVNTGVAPQSPPFPSAAITGPTPPSGCTTTITKLPSAGSTIDAGGGVECINISNPVMGGYTMQNGVFLFENGVTLTNGSGTTQVLNATIDVYQGVFTQGSATNLKIHAPTSGTYNGVALLVPAANTYYNQYTSKTNGCESSKPGKGNKPGNELQLQFGSSNETFDGYIMAPAAELYLQDSGGGGTYSGLYAACLDDQTSQITITSYNSEHPTTTPVRQVSLVE